MEKEILMVRPIYTTEGKGWLRPQDSAKFHKYQDLVSGGLTYTKPEVDKKLFALPNLKSKYETLKEPSEDLSSQIVKKIISDHLW